MGGTNDSRSLTGISIYDLMVNKKRVSAAMDIYTQRYIDMGCTQIKDVFGEHFCVGGRTLF